MVLRVSALAELDQRPSAAGATRSRVEAQVAGFLHIELGERLRGALAAR